MIYYTEKIESLILPIPKCHNTNKNKEKICCMTDSNRISKINSNLGDFNYDFMQKLK